VSATQAKSWDAQGRCSGGACVYASHLVTCTSGSCANGVCPSDPCAGITCSSPPSVCFGASGTCAGGSCSYPYADGAGCDDGDSCTGNDRCETGVCKGTPLVCNSPPAPACQSATTLRVYSSSSGTCKAGACSYSFTDTACQFGCAAGACSACGAIGKTCGSSASCCGHLQCVDTLRTDTSVPVCACNPSGGGCGADSDCCAGLVCSAGSCHAPAACTAPLASCALGETCCGGLACLYVAKGPVVPEKLCCAPVGAPCSDSTECCGGTFCRAGRCGCNVAGLECLQDEDCCNQTISDGVTHCALSQCE
jgi:hypothetical protein